MTRVGEIAPSVTYDGRLGSEPSCRIVSVNIRPWTPSHHPSSGVRPQKSGHGNTKGRSARYPVASYGKRTVLASNGTTVLPESSVDSQIGFTGRYHDEETGLVYFRARYYEPVLGRFVSRDPIEYDGGGMSLYCGYFVPIDSDPTGFGVSVELETGGSDPSNPVSGTGYSYVDVTSQDGALGESILPVSKRKVTCTCDSCPTSGGGTLTPAGYECPLMIPQFKITCKITAAAHIYLDPRFARHDIGSNTKAGVYGHEQRHLLDYLQHLNDIGNNAWNQFPYEDKDKCVSYSDCDKNKKTIQDALEKEVKAYVPGGHAPAPGVPEDPGRGQYQVPPVNSVQYPLIGTMPPTETLFGH